MSKEAVELPKGWKEVESKSRPGKVYYLHLKTGDKTWKMAHVLAKEREFRRRAAAHAAHKDKKNGGERVHVRNRGDGSEEPRAKSRELTQMEDCRRCIFWSSMPSRDVRRRGVRRRSRGAKPWRLPRLRASEKSWRRGARRTRM